MKKETVTSLLEIYGWIEIKKVNNPYMWSYLFSNNNGSTSRMNIYYGNGSVTVQYSSRRHLKSFKDVDLVKLEMIAKGDL